jgi:hypothetical protein
LGAADHSEGADGHRWPGHGGSQGRCFRGFREGFGYMEGVAVMLYPPCLLPRLDSNQ